MATTITIDGKQYAIVPADLSQEMLLAWTQYALDPEQTPDGRETWTAMLASAPPVPLSAVLQAIYEAEGTYPMPSDGWVCFFCGERFTTEGAARDHFGAEPFADAACQIKADEERGLVMALRRAQEELGRYRAEDSDKDREFHAMRADHQRALTRAEEAGYERGLRERTDD